MARPKKRSQAGARATVEKYLREGWLAVAREHPRRAERQFRRALLLDRENAEAWHGLGVALHRQGRHQEAYDALHTSLRLNPNVPEAWHALAYVADALGYSIEALESARRSLNLAESQGLSPEVVEGLRVTVRALEQSLARLAREMGVDLAEEGGLERLRDCVRAYQAGVEAVNAGEYARAEENFRECVRLAPENARAWSNLGLAQLFLHRLDEAERSLRRALELVPDYEPARRNLEALYRAREQPDADLEAFLHRYTDIKHNAPTRREFR